MKKPDIAIVGMSIFCPGANNINEFWHNLSNGVDSIIDVPNDVIDHSYFDNPDGSIDRFYCRKGGFTSTLKIDPLRYGILPITAEGMDPEHLFTLGGVEQALFDAQVFQKKISLKKCSIILGKGNFAGLIALRSAEIIRTAAQITQLIRTTLPDIPEEDVQKIKKEYQAQLGRYQADTAIGTMPNLVASMVANKFDMQGPAYTVDAACASGLLAVDQSINLLSSGECDIAVAGGIHSGQSPMFWSAFNMMGALSKKQKISPFSEDADGLLIGQGGGIVILKTLDKAIQDKDRIYAVIKGTGVCSDGGGSHVMVTSVQGQKRVLDLAWKNSGLDPKDIGYIETHGTATPVGDKTELSTLTEFFGDDSCSRAFLGSVKSNIGHTMPAAGMIGLIKTALSLYHRKIPPTLNCEKPLEAMFKSRFRPAQELIDWDETKYPLVAGVNAFGFGGINSHAILVAHKDENQRKTIAENSLNTDKTIVFSATSKDEMINKIETNDFTISEGGNYRMVIFNPSDEKIEFAKSVVKKEKNCKGIKDIWFSNDPLITKGGKVVFLFPGFDPNVKLETDSISDFFNLTKIDYEKLEREFNKSNKSKTRVLQQEERGTKQFYNSLLNDMALKELEIFPDMYAGFSIGEWYATRASGLISDDSIIRMMEFTDVDRDRGPDMEDTYYISVYTSYEKLKPFCDKIDQLYLAVDCCPNNVLLCGTTESRDILIEYLDKEKILYYVLPFKSGFHTPFLEGGPDSIFKSIDHVEMLENNIPVWSAISLGLYPNDKKGFKQLVMDNFTKPLYFNGLIKKLFKEENARIFVQIGAGGLVEFIDDILKGENYGAISTSNENRSSVEQIRRVLAVLFINGKELNYNFLKVLGIKLENYVTKNVYSIPSGAKIVQDFPLLKEAVKKYCNSGTFSVEPVKNNKNSLIQAMNENFLDMNKSLKNMVSVQNEMTQLFGEKEFINSTLNKEILLKNPEYNNDQPKRKGTSFEERFYVNLEDHPYLLDHAVIKQPKNWKYTEDLNPIIPMTMILELFAEIAHRQVPTRKIVKIGPAIVMKWMSTEKPFDEKITGTWKTEDIVVMEIKGYANIEITFDDEYPLPPQEYLGNIDIGKEIMPPPTIYDVYDKYAFHGPAYHTNVRMEKVAERGILCDAQKKEGKGSLLDNIGQSLGLFLHLTQTKNMISFPVRFKEICFYQDMFDQEGLFKQTTIITSLTETFEIGDVVLKRDGKLWAVTKGWVGQRFEFDQKMWNIILKPNSHKLAKEIAPNVYFYDDISDSKLVILLFLSKRYLNYPEKQYIETLSIENQKEFLTSRIAIKDSIRSFIKKENEGYIFPIEISIEHDDKGKPNATGSNEIENLEISLSHKGLKSVAITSNKPVGIDIEIIQDRDDSFKKLSFTENELNLLKDKNSAEWITRFWVAKEAYSKMIGLGLEGNPKKYEISKVENESLFIEDIEIQTMKYDNNYIVGWTK